MNAMVSPASFTGGGGGGGGGFTVPLDTTTSLGGAAVAGPVAINTSEVTAMPAGGVAPYTYAWAITAPDAAWSILTPGAATTQFRRTAVVAGNTHTANFTCTVTDARGVVATSAPVQATVTNYGAPGGFLP